MTTLKSTTVGDPEHTQDIKLGAIQAARISTFAIALVTTLFRVLSYVM